MKTLVLTTFVLAIVTLVIAQETKSMNEQAEQAAKRAKVRYVNEAMKRTELKDEDFVQHGREDVTALGRELLSCWTELDGIKKVLLERR